MMEFDFVQMLAAGILLGMIIRMLADLIRVAALRYDRWAHRYRGVQVPPGAVDDLQAEARAIIDGVCWDATG